MTDNDIKVEGAHVISEALKINTKLTSLNLSCEKDKIKGKTRKEREMMLDL